MQRNHTGAIHTCFNIFQGKKDIFRYIPVTDSSELGLELRERSSPDLLPSASELSLFDDSEGDRDLDTMVLYSVLKPNMSLLLAPVVDAILGYVTMALGSGYVTGALVTVVESPSMLSYDCHSASKPAVGFNPFCDLGVP